MASKSQAGIKGHIGILVIFIILYVLAVVVLVLQPKFGDIPQLATPYTFGTYAYTKFGLSIQAMVFIYVIAIFLLNRWVKTGKKNTPTLLWGIAFLFFGIVFIGMALESFGIPWANSSDPNIFYLFRSGMVVWAALMYLGISKILNFSTKFQRIPTIGILAFGYSWFSYGLLVVKSVEYTMYGFVYLLWTPVAATIAYCFYLYGGQFKFLSPRIMALGFALLGISYLGWAPWHAPATLYVYYIWFFIFVLSLAFVMTGYLLLPYEIAAKTKPPEQTEPRVEEIQQE